MAELQNLRQLSAHHCVLLAVQYASQSNINALRKLTAVRVTDFDLELVLRILLTYLPESVDPSIYTAYLAELVHDARSANDDHDDYAVPLDTSFVEKLTDSQARKKRRNIGLLKLAHPLYRAEAELDTLSHFLIHRAHLVDTETGQLELVPQLLAPFLHHSEHLRTWFISSVLPLLRLGYEYYPEMTIPSLDDFARMKGRRAVDAQLSHLRRSHERTADGASAARDLRGVVGPWLCGADERKRRKPSDEDRRPSTTEASIQEPDDWECLFEWLVHTSKTNLPLVASAVVEWDGPEDMDLGGFEEGRDYVDDEVQGKLELRYAQTALACLYLVDDSSAETIQTAHALLARIAELLNVEPPPGLNVVVSALPSYNLSTSLSREASGSALQLELISRSDNALTRPDQDAVRLLELFLFSSCLLSSLQHPLSIRQVARMYLRANTSEQASLLHKIVYALGSGAKKDGEEWKAIRAKLFWLWGWGTTSADGDRYAQGLFGSVDSRTLETEILKGLLESSHYLLASRIYIESPSARASLPIPEVERVVLEAAMQHYDNASNGNRTRGGMKRAFDIISTFKPHFATSPRFHRIEALLSATHAMSFYSLTLQHGVPFQPVNIRISIDPLSLIKTLLSQNSRSYTHLDDMISIGQNLVIAMPSTIMIVDTNSSGLDLAANKTKTAAAERRVVGMTVEAALQEDDFETAYSYVVNRLTPNTLSPVVSPALSTSSQRFSFESDDSARAGDDGEDVAWRAALEAGRYRSSLSSSMTWIHSSTAARPDLRRLEQRMDLLSQALLLAPPRNLEEVLAVWQECETEMTTLLAEETEAEERFNDAADRRLPGSFTNDIVAVQPRREVGRGAVEEAPMGLFDVARGAAAAFSKTAFPLRGNIIAPKPENHDTSSDTGRVSMDLSDSGSISGNDERVRRRDMVANAVTGGLASGIGWVLGANPVNNRERE